MKGLRSVAPDKTLPVDSSGCWADASLSEREIAFMDSSE